MFPGGRRGIGMATFPFRVMRAGDPLWMARNRGPISPRGEICGGHTRRGMAGVIRAVAVVGNARNGRFGIVRFVRFARFVRSAIRYMRWGLTRMSRPHRRRVVIVAGAVIEGVIITVV